MSDHKKILKRVGFVIIFFSLIDVAVKIYFLGNKFIFPSLLDLFISFVGIFLIFGRLETAKTVESYTAFFLAGFLSMVLLWPIFLPSFMLPIMKPIDLWIIEYRNNPINTVLFFLSAPITICLLLWIYKRLRSPEVLKAQLSIGQSASTPKGAFLLGITIVILLTLAVRLTVDKDADEKAMKLAKAQIGSEYKYWVVSMSWSNGHYHATVDAYRQNEIKTVKVEWNNENR